MKKTIIINKHHNISKLENFIDRVSNHFELYSTYHSNITIVSDIVFNFICEAKDEHNVSISLEQDTDALHFIWSFDKLLFNSLNTLMEDKSSFITMMLEKLSDAFYLDYDCLELHLYFATGSVNHLLSLDRRRNLQKYFGNLEKQNHFNDTLSDN